MKNTVIIIVLNIFFLNLSLGYELPQNNPKFTQVILSSKIQWQDEKLETKVSKKAYNIANKYFYLSEDENMTFEMHKNKNQSIRKPRSELRQRTNWKTSENIWNGMRGTLKFEKPSNIQELTWVQIHDDTKTNKPLLRLFWLEEDDHLWAILRTNTHRKLGKYKTYNLGKRPDGFFDFNIKVKNNILIITVNNLTFKQDVTYWGNLESYFKAGAYLNGNSDFGSTKVTFKQLDYFKLNEPPSEPESKLITSTPLPIDEWFTELKYGNLENTKRENDHTLSPVIGWKSKKWRLQFQQDISLRDSKSRERLVFETSYAAKGNASDEFYFVEGFKLFNKIERRKNNKNWTAEISPTWYKHITANTQVGAEIAIDYYDESQFDLYNVGIEPTIRSYWTYGTGEFKAELELPRVRLYSKKKKRDDFKIEGIEASASYRFPLDSSKNTHLKFSVVLPYDSEKKELREKFFLSIRRKFK